MYFLHLQSARTASFTRQEETEEIVVTKWAVISSRGRSPSLRLRKKDGQRPVGIPSARKPPPASHHHLQTIDDDQLAKENLVRVEHNHPIQISRHISI